MEQINAFFDSISVLKKLGVDSTIIFQFIIFLVTFFILKAVFFSKLLFVLEQREGKTTKLEGKANEKFAEAERMATKYGEEIHGANVEAQSLFSEKKNQIIDKERARFKAEESKVNDELDQKRKEIEADFMKKKEELLKSADSLAGDLSNRLTT